MGKLLGRVQRLYVGTDTPTTKVGNLVEGSLQGQRGEVTTTDCDSGDWEEYAPGRKNATMELTCRYNEADEGQNILMDNFFDPTDSLIKIKYMLEEKTGAKMYTADAFVTNWQPSAPDGDVDQLSITLRVNKVVPADQTTGG
jgi:hypothetical protein